LHLLALGSGVETYTRHACNAKPGIFHTRVAAAAWSLRNGW